MAARFAPSRLETWIQSRKRAASNIRFHYDLSNDFYGKFLDCRRVYSAASFKKRDWSLEEAQHEKLEGICRGPSASPRRPLSRCRLWVRRIIYICRGRVPCN